MTARIRERVLSPVSDEPDNLRRSRPVQDPHRVRVTGTAGAPPANMPRAGCSVALDAHPMPDDSCDVRSAGPIAALCEVAPLMTLSPALSPARAAIYEWRTASWPSRVGGHGWDAAAQITTTRLPVAGNTDGWKFS